MIFKPNLVLLRIVNILQKRHLYIKFITKISAPGTNKNNNTIMILTIKQANLMFISV